MKKKYSLKEDIQLYKRLLLNYIRPFWVAFLVSIVGSAIFSSIDASITYLFKPLLDMGFIERKEWFVRWAPLLILSAFFVRGAANFISNYAMNWVARSVILLFRQQIFRHLLKLPAQFFDHHPSGELLSKLLYDVEQIAKISTDSITEMIQSLCLIVGLIGVMFLISWKLTLIYLITAPLIAWLIRYSSLRIRRISREMQKSMSSITQIAEEVIEGYRAVKIYSGQNYEQEKFDRASRETRHRDMKVEVTKSLTVAMVQFIAASGISFIVFLAISPHSTMLLSAGGFVSMMVSMIALLRPMKTITTLNVVIQRGLAGAQSVFELLDQAEEKDSGQKILSHPKGRIEYQNVCFGYHQSKQTVLHEINFKVEPGQTVALVGRSGAGKTTIASLLPRLYELDKGSITIDGVDIRELSLKHLRDQIALVSQHVVLFNDTIANNIAYGCNSSMSRAQIEEAAHAANVTQFASHFSQGLDTLIGENGVLLSGGQRQRIAIARAILKNAPILILDEATSALDTESERYIQGAVERLKFHRTTLVIAHRLSTIESADLILVMEQGKIIEQGSHQDLIAAEGQYHKLYKMQFQSLH